MIARYTRPEMGHIWSDQNKFRTWLEVELAATETLAEAGLVPQSAAVAIREKGDFDLDRINQIEAEVKHDVIAFTTAVAEKVGPGIALAALRTYLERRGRHRAGPADQAGVGHHSRGPEEVARRPEAARLGVQGHAHDRPHPRRPCRAHHLWPEAGQLVFRDAAQHRALRTGRRANARRQALGRRRQRRPSRSRIRREDLPAAGIERRRGLVAGHPARPPRVLRRHAGGHRVDARQDRNRNPPPAAHRGPRGRRVLQREAERLVGDAAQAQSR